METDITGMFRSHADVYEGLKNYYSKYRSVPDIEILTKDFRDFAPEDTTGPTAYYLDKLREDYLSSNLRQLLITAADALKTEGAAEVLGKIEKNVSKLNRITKVVRDINLTDYESAEDYYEGVRERSALMGGSPGIPTGFKSIDLSYPTGLAGGHLVVCIGWPGRGKTFFAAYLACKAWQMGFRPMIVSLEMSPEDMRNRIYALMASGIFRISDFQRGMVNVDDFRSWGKKTLADKQEFIIVSNEGVGDVTPNIIQAKIDQHRPNLVICDYHQLFNDNKGSGSEVERNKNISREFKQLAMRNNIPVIDITAATMDDISDQDNPPLLSQVAWSKAIEYDADMAFAVHRHADSDIIEVVSRKNRHGRDFAMLLDIDLDRGLMTEHHVQ